MPDRTCTREPRPPRVSLGKKNGAPLRNGKRPTILVSESAEFSAEAAELLGQLGEVHLADLDRPGLLAAVPKADVLLIRLRHRIDEEVLRAAPRLKIIATLTTGLDRIDLDAAARRGIRVVGLSEEPKLLKGVYATAEHTLGLMLALLRHVPAAADHARKGGWDRDLFKGRELHGKTVGIVGYGRLGRMLGRLLKPFKARLLAVDPHADPCKLDAGVTLVSLPLLLREAEIVSLHVKLNEGTRGFFGRKQFATMRKGAWFINTSRGELIDEAALLDALRCRRLAGAALDVLCGENAAGMKNHPLVRYARQADNLLITPHIGGCTRESMTKTELLLATRLGKCLREVRQC